QATFCPLAAFLPAIDSYTARQASDRSLPLANQAAVMRVRGRYRSRAIPMTARLVMCDGTGSKRQSFGRGTPLAGIQAMPAAWAAIATLHSHDSQAPSLIG